MCIVFNDSQSVSSCDVQYNVHFARHSCVVDYYDSLCFLSDCIFDLAFINILSVTPNIYKHRNAPVVHKRRGR